MRRIGLKLFLAIVAVNGLLALLAYLLISWSFGRGFIDYLNRSEQARLEPLVAVLAENYGRHQGWDWLAGDWRRWRTFLRRHFAAGDGSGDGPANPHPLTFDPRLLLLDGRGEVLIGRPHHAAQALRRPIRWQGEVVGYLGYLPRQELAQSIDRLFAARQQRNFAVVALLMLAAAALLAAGIGRWLS
ncbi:MAG: hypothetical protein M3Z21_04570, partial [Pseudomonadota bacterium]|nr:hypothetical protein [Pseudomonadota bacterium]